MTTLAQRIKETPMAPYMALLRGMTREQKQIVVTPHAQVPVPMTIPCRYLENVNEVNCSRFLLNIIKYLASRAVF